MTVNIHDLAERYPTLPFILSFIGMSAKNLPYKHRVTGKTKYYQKKHDAQATFKEIKDYLTDLVKIKKGISKSMIYLLLQQMEDKWGLIKSVGRETPRKPAVYTLTPLGREAQHLSAMWFDLKIKIGETSGVLGHDEDAQGQLYFVPMIQLKKREDVNLILKAMTYASEKREADKFLNDIIEMQRLAILVYCSSFVNPGVSIALKELLGKRGIEKAPKILLDLFKLFLS